MSHIQIKYWSGGKIKSIGYYVDGKKEGFWMSWYDNDGEWPEFEGYYQNDKPYGFWRGWWPDGQIICEGEYWNGYKHGCW